MLIFSKPPRPVNGNKDLVFPNPKGIGNYLLPHFEKLALLRKKPSMWRNVLALYLRAAQMPTAEIAQLLEISPSRVNSVIRLARKKVFTGSIGISIRGKRVAHKPIAIGGQEFSADDARRHAFRVETEEMDAAEKALEVLVGQHGNIIVISEGLKRGRMSYQMTKKKLGKRCCPCAICQLDLRKLG